MMHPLLALFAVLALTQTPDAAPPVQGLAAGETATRLAPGPVPFPTDTYAHGRVVDAFTAQPLQGATIELWSEEIDDHYGGYHRFGSATTGVDGRYAVKRRDGARTAEKLRVTAPGYLVFTEAAGMADEVIPLFPAEATAPRLRLIDLQGRPIQGARVTSTYTCAHDVPAVDVTSDEDGVVVLAGYGLQDAIPELRVLAPGFAGIKYLDGEPILMAAARREVYTQRLRRLRGAEFRFLDEEGQRVANEVVMVHDGDGHHVVRTDDEGRVTLPARYDEGELTVQRLAPEPGPGAYGSGSVLRANGSDWGDDVPVGRVRIAWTGAPEGATTEGLEVQHMEGWTAEVDAEGWVELPAGAAVLVHDPRSGTMQRAYPPIIVIADATALVEMPWQEPLWAADFPAGLDTTVVVEQGDHSHEHRLDAETPTRIPLDDTAPFTLWFPEADVVASYDAELRPRELAELLERVAAARTAANEPHARAETRLRVPAEVAVAADSPGRGDLVLQVEGDEVTVEGPRGPVLLSFARDGHATRWARALLGVSASTSAADLPAFASLRVTSADGTELAVEGYADAGDLQRLHPGPFHCVVQHADGSRLALQLELAPGEARTVVVPSK